VKLAGPTAKFSKTLLEKAYGREMDIKLSVNSSGGHFWSQQANCTLPQKCVLCDKTEHFRVAFYCPQAQGAPV
jgi:hypothetical protein